MHNSLRNIPRTPKKRPTTKYIKGAPCARRAWNLRRVMPSTLKGFGVLLCMFVLVCQG